MTLSKELAETKKLLDWIDEALADAKIATPDGTKLPEKIRSSSAGLHQTIEHGFAIQTLLSGASPLAGSAFALLRPLFEGFIRSVWLLHCATEAQARNFLEKDVLKFNLNTLIERVEKQHIAFAGGKLSQLKAGAWDAMCSYSHGGAHQLRRRVADGAIGPQYSDEEKIEVLKAVNVFSLFAACEIAVLANMELWKEILERLRHEVGAV